MKHKWNSADHGWKGSKSILFLLLIFSLLVMGGCGDKSSGTIEQPAEIPENPVSEQEEKLTERMLTDQMGREIVLPQEVNRVISTHRPLTFFVYAVGGQEKLVAVDNNSATSPFLQEIYPQVAELPTVGTKKEGLNIEAIVAAQPDVVILANLKGNDVVLEQLETQGIAAVVLDPESVVDMKETARIMGIIFNQEEQATELIAYYEETEKLIADRLTDLQADEKKRVYMTGSEVLKTPSADMYQHYLIEKAGGINVAQDLLGGFSQVSTEQVVAWNPDVIIGLQYCKESLTDVVATNPQLASVTAVQEGEVYRFPSNLVNWDYPEPSSALGMLWLAQKLYPEQLADIDIQVVADQFYQQFYGKSFSEIGGVIETEW